MASELQELMWGAGILALPLLLALPMRLAWQFWVGVGHEVSEYRNDRAANRGFRPPSLLFFSNP